MKKCVSFPRISVRIVPRASAGTGVCVRLHPCHGGAGPAQEPCLGNPSGSSPALCSHKGNWGGKKQQKRASQSQSIHDVLQQCVFVSFLKALPEPRLSFYSLSGLGFSDQGQWQCLSRDLAVTVASRALSIPKRGKAVSSRMQIVKMKLGACGRGGQVPSGAGLSYLRSSLCMSCLSLSGQRWKG